MKLTKARARKGVRWGEVDLSAVPDSRKGAVRFEHAGLLRLLLAGFASGVQTLRAIESFGDRLSRHARRSLGLTRGPSDTTLYRLLSEQKVSGFALALVGQVKDALLRKRIGNDLFPQGVVAIDGKSIWTGHHRATPLCQDQGSSNGRPNFGLMSQRASLVSSSARPCITQTLIPPSAGESDTFPRTFRFLLKHFRRSFEFVTYDAGAASRENARLVHEANKAYVFAVKGSQPRVFAAAKSRLGTKDAPGDEALSGKHRSVEREDGADVTRELFSCPVDAEDPELEFPGARQLWRVRKTVVRKLPSGRAETSVEDRYFITNRVLRADLALTIVRLHWGIENGPNWTLDVVFGEDDGAPCETGNGIVVTSWLRLLAYNLTSIWRRHLKPVRDEVVATWRRSCESLRDTYRDFTPEPQATLV